MNYILFDGEVRDSLLPFTFTRPVADIRIGILTIREKWEKLLSATTSTKTEQYLSKKYPLVNGPANILINASFCPTEEIASIILKLKKNEAVFKEDLVIAYFAEDAEQNVNLSDFKKINFEGDLLSVVNTWDIFSKNGIALTADFDLITKGRKSAPISSTNHLINAENIFLEEGASVEYSILNATNGPIYLGKDSEILEGNLIRGAFALCEKAVVKMGAKIYGPTTVGPYGKVCGEINNSVIFGYSSKGHDGYLGNCCFRGVV